MKPARAIEEQVWWLEVNGERIAGGTVLPEALEPFFVGQLVSAGLVAARADLLSLNVNRLRDGIIAARALVPLARARAAADERRHRAIHGCGALYYVLCIAQQKSGSTFAAPPLENFPALFRALDAAADARHAGGVHSAALSDGVSLRHQHEDVGRDNAVDKAIGAAILAGEDVHGSGLVVTSRISGEIAAKAARAGLHWVASRSVPTTLAVRIAAAQALTLIARAAGPAAAVFAAPPP